MKALLVLILLNCLIWASKISVRDELKVIEELLAEREKEISTFHFYNISIQLHMNNLLLVDPIELLDEMMEISDNDRGIASFWLYLDVALIGTLPPSKQGFPSNVVNLMVLNYKIWVIHILLYIYQDKCTQDNQADKGKFLEKAMEFYNEWFRSIELKRNSGRNYMRRLYRQCQVFLNNDPKSLIISEYYQFKTLIENNVKNRRKFKFHLENFFFLVNFLSSSHENLFNLEWLAGQPADFIFYYLYCYGYPALLNVSVNRIYEDFTDFSQMKRVVIHTLHDFLPIFNQDGDDGGILFSEFINNIEVYSSGEIIDIAYRILTKINKFLSN
jgi:hypothetical protein